MPSHSDREFSTACTSGGVLGVLGDGGDPDEKSKRDDFRFSFGKGRDLKNFL